MDEQKRIVMSGRQHGKTEAARKSGALFIGIDPAKPEGDQSILFFYDDQGRPVHFPVHEAHKTFKKEFERWYLGDFTPTPDPLHDLVEQYHERTEAYDRTVCTGPIGIDGIMPATPRELGLINRNARAVRSEIIREAVNLGFTEQQFNEAMRTYARSCR